MKINKLADQVWECENFLDQDQVSTLLEIAKSADEDLWFNPFFNDEGCRRALELSNVEGRQDEVRALNGYIYKKLDDIFYDYEKILGVAGGVVRGSKEFEVHGEHRDNDAEGDKNLAYGALLYLNDDYVGGEIYYPEIGVKYKPRPGSLIVHYVGLLHGVKPVTEGVRYSMTGFLEGLDTKHNLDLLA